MSNKNVNFNHLDNYKLKVTPLPKKLESALERQNKINNQIEKRITWNDFNNKNNIKKDDNIVIDVKKTNEPAKEFYFIY